jgi:hypothetical protein
MHVHCNIIGSFSYLQFIYVFISGRMENVVNPDNYIVIWDNTNVTGCYCVK